MGVATGPTHAAVPPDVAKSIDDLSHGPPIDNKKKTDVEKKGDLIRKLKEFSEGGFQTTMENEDNPKDKGSDKLATGASYIQKVLNATKTVCSTTGYVIPAPFDIVSKTLGLFLGVYLNSKALKGKCEESLARMGVVAEIWEAMSKHYTKLEQEERDNIKRHLDRTYDMMMKQLEVVEKVLSKKKGMFAKLRKFADLQLNLSSKQIEDFTKTVETVSSNTALLWNIYTKSKMLNDLQESLSGIQRSEDLLVELTTGQQNLKEILDQEREERKREREEERKGREREREQDRKEREQLAEALNDIREKIADLKTNLQSVGTEANELKSKPYDDNYRPTRQHLEKQNGDARKMLEAAREQFEKIEPTKASELDEEDNGLYSVIKNGFEAVEQTYRANENTLQHAYATEIDAFLPSDQFMSAAVDFFNLGPAVAAVNSARSKISIVNKSSKPRRFGCDRDWPTDSGSMPETAPGGERFHPRCPFKTYTIFIDGKDKSITVRLEKKFCSVYVYDDDNVSVVQTDG